MLAVQLLDPLQDAQTRAHGALGVVAVRDRRAEHGHDRVADELLEHAAVLLDPLLRLGVVELQRVAHVLRIGAIRARREADEVDEEDGDELPLLAAARSARPSGAPQLLQKREPGGFSSPQLGHSDFDCGHR